MILASDYPFMDIFWTMVIFFVWCAWIWTLVMVLSDAFRSDISGWAKAAWTIFIVFLPFLGVLVYLIARGSEMGERREQAIGAMLDRGNAQHVATATSSGGSAAEIAEAKRLLDSGAINEAEYAQLKTNVLY
jgi:hypothetical protein